MTTRGLEDLQPKLKSIFELPRKFHRNRKRAVVVQRCEKVIVLKDYLHSFNILNK
jgi:hypothetical protein